MDGEDNKVVEAVDGVNREETIMDGEDNNREEEETIMVGEMMDGVEIRVNKEETIMDGDNKEEIIVEEVTADGVDNNKEEIITAGEIRANKVETTMDGVDSSRVEETIMAGEMMDGDSNSNPIMMVGEHNNHLIIITAGDSRCLHLLKTMMDGEIKAINRRKTMAGEMDGE